MPTTIPETKAKTNGPGAGCLTFAVGCAQYAAVFGIGYSAATGAWGAIALGVLAFAALLLIGIALEMAKAKRNGRTNG